jgi:rod shape determining protein RodA
LYFIYEQPDTSTTIVTAFIFVVLLFIAGLSYKIIGAVLGIAIPVAIVAVTYLFSHAEELIEKGYYQMKRIMAWKEPTNPLYADKALQQQNSIMAIGSGQLWGKGLGNDAATSAKNTNFIIEPQTDFIFAVAGEELGFVGTAAIIILLFLIVIECIIIGRKAKDLSGRLICCGMASLVGFQSFVNICVATGLMPNTGVTLPFVSYGLTSLVSLYIGMGFVLNVGLQPLKYTKGVTL